MKVLLTVFASAVLLLHTQPIDHVATLATQRLLTPDDLWRLRLQLVGECERRTLRAVRDYDAVCVQAVGIDTVRHTDAGGGIPAAPRQDGQSD